MTGWLRGRGPRPVQDELAQERERRQAESVPCQLCKVPKGGRCVDRPDRPVPGAGYHPARLHRARAGWPGDR